MIQTYFQFYLGKINKKDKMKDKKLEKTFSKYYFYGINILNRQIKF